MKPPIFPVLILVGGILGMAAAAQAQQSTNEAAGSAATATAPQPKPGPSASTLKKAKENGYRAKLRKGVTLFCKEETEIGTHFSSENCINENQLEFVLERQQAQRDQMTNRTCSSGGACGGK